MNKINLHILLTTLIVLTPAIKAHAQFDDLKGLKNKIKQTVETNTKGQGTNLSAAEIADGLKAALQIGAENATKRLSAQDGFFGDALIKVLMPEDAKKVESWFRNAGQGATVDKLILSLNRAAEDASTRAFPIFASAVQHMTIQDGMNILKGQQDAATQYLKSNTTAALTKEFTPVIKDSLEKVNATRYWSDVFTTYNKLPMVKEVNPDLVAYVVERALNGMFVHIAQEEAKIRTNPAARVSEILKKVFK